MCWWTVPFFLNLKFNNWVGSFLCKVTWGHEYCGDKKSVNPCHGQNMICLLRSVWALILVRWIRMMHLATLHYCHTGLIQTVAFLTSKRLNLHKPHYNTEEEHLHPLQERTNQLWLCDTMTKDIPVGFYTATQAPPFTHIQQMNKNINKKAAPQTKLISPLLFYSSEPTQGNPDPETTVTSTAMKKTIQPQVTDEQKLLFSITFTYTQSHIR